MSGQWLIRTAETEEDARAISLLWAKLVDYHLDLDANMPVAAEDGAYRYAQRISHSMNDSYSRVLVADHNGVIIGYVLGIVIDLLPEMFVEERTGFLADIYVDEAWRSHGVGTALVEALANWFRSRGVEYMEWYVASANADGIAFWKSRGGAEIMQRMRMSIKSEDT